jgi:hypothetical protein
MTCGMAEVDRFVPRGDGIGCVNEMAYGEEIGCGGGVECGDRRGALTPYPVIANGVKQSMSLCDGRNSHLQLVDLCGFSLENAREARGEK